jgi:hypothetical protein
MLFAGAGLTRVGKPPDLKYRCRPLSRLICWTFETSSSELLTARIRQA